ncbi:hypothetical protein ACNOYE_37215 [Nannocystaceae bacterium ST9]
MSIRSPGPALASACLLMLVGCEFAIADWYYVDRPRAMGARVEVVELGPSWPARVGYDPLDPPITEPMPGDVLRLEPLMVDGEGRELEPASIDAIWFQCGTDRCVRDGELVAGLDDDCSALAEWTTDSSCKLGAGGQLEFEVPAIGQLTVFTRYAYYFMVAAVDDSRTAESCWAARQKADHSLDGCVFTDREVKIGPSWLLLVEAALTGLEQDIPVYEIPFAVFGQASNRVPVYDTLRLQRHLGDGSMITDVDGPIHVRPGERLTVRQHEWRWGYDLQPYFTARETLTPDTYVFLPAVELMWTEWYTSGSLARIDDGTTGFVELVIDEQAKPGSTSRLILLWGDDRGSEDMRVFEFEVDE